MSRLFLLLVSGLLCLLTSLAQASNGQITKIVPSVHDGQLLLDVDVSFDLSTELRDAASKGVPLYFTIDLEIKHPRWWWFDKTVLTDEQTWRIQFNALTRQWRIGTTGLSIPTTTLNEALDQVRHIRNWPIGHPDQLEPEAIYEGQLRLRLDTSRLARPFQVDALNSKAWSLTTPWKKFNFSISAVASPN